MKIEYTIKSGKNAGVICVPHKTKDGFYIVSKTRFKEDYINVGSKEAILPYLDRGYHLRVSGLHVRTAPSLISKESLVIA